MVELKIIVKMKTYFETKDGKTQPYPFKKGELEKYKLICFHIWGGVPHDVNWAMGTEIYKNAEKKYEEGSLC